LSERRQDRRLRASPGFELVLLDRLEAAERELVRGSGGGEDVYGILRPRAGSALAPRVVSTDTALLFLTLEEPQPLPGYVRAKLGTEVERAIGALVLDGVLELEHERGFVSGSEAAPLLDERRTAGGDGRLSDLSVAALRYGQGLGPLEESQLATRLYLFGRIPASPALRQRWPDEDAVAAELGIGSGGGAEAALAAAWAELPGGKEEAALHWRSWRPRRAAAGPRGRSGARCKLYVSPAIEALPAALTGVAELLRGAPGLSGFKVGRDLGGICRPDKLVVYFDRIDDLRRAGAALRERLDGCPAHGVPFTAPLTADGLLSWGADPPPDPAGGRDRSSWRLWIVERLAEYLTQARQAGPAGVEPWRFALERLRLTGVDTETWAPASGIWAEAR
jgi:hypothetical protein